MSSGSVSLRALGKNGPSVRPVGLGLMGSSPIISCPLVARPLIKTFYCIVAIGAFYGTPSTQEEVDKLLSFAHEGGSCFWDTSDIYGECRFDHSHS